MRLMAEDRHRPGCGYMPAVLERAFRGEFFSIQNKAH